MNRKKSNGGIKHYSCLFFALMTILSYYGYGFASFAFIIPIFLFFIVYKNRGKLSFVYPKMIVFYFLYFAFTRILCNIGVSTTEMIAPSILYIFLLFGFLLYETDYETCLKYYRYVVDINMGLFFIQEIVVSLFNIRILGIFSFLPLSTEFNLESMMNAERSSGFFSEPAHMAQFMLPITSIYLLDKDVKRKWRGFLYASVLIMTFSGNAVLGLSIIGLFFCAYLFSNLHPIVTILSVSILSIIICVFMGWFISTEKGEALYNRQSEINSDEIRYSSGFERLFRMYYVYDEFTTAEKIFGLNSNTELKRRIQNSQINHLFHTKDDIYMNGFQTILVYTGWVGVFLFGCALMYLWQGNSLSGKCCIAIYIVLLFIACVFWSYTMILYLLPAIQQKMIYSKVRLLKF